MNEGTTFLYKFLGKEDYLCKRYFKTFIFFICLIRKYNANSVNNDNDNNNYNNNDNDNEGDNDSNNDNNDNEEKTLPLFMTIGRFVVIVRGPTQ